MHRDSVATTESSPLTGIRVLDLSRALAGPFCTMILGDMGAEVIKVENPAGGDETRAWGPPDLAGESGYYLSTNRNKRSVTVNLRTPEGAQIIRRLSGKCDILVENFAPGVTDRYGIDWGSLRAVNGKLIYCTVSSFAPDTSYTGMPGYDFVIQAMSGLMSVTGQLDGEPQKVGVAVVDVLTGLFACTAILGALHRRDASGQGENVGVSLLDAALASLVNVASNFLITGRRPNRWGNAHANLVPYQTFETATKPIAIGIGNDGQFRKLCAVIARPELADDLRFQNNPARVRNREALVELLAETFREHPASHWVHALVEARVPAAPVNNVDEIFGDPYIAEAGMVTTVPHPTAEEVPLVSSPLLFDGKRPEVREHPPLLGEHTDDVLCNLLGMDAEEIDTLRRREVI